MYPQRSVMTCGLATALEPPHFNPRTRVGCDCCAKLWGLTVYLFQSTHPRGVRHGEGQHDTVFFKVSIHAPAWGATRERGGETGDECVSIHAPAWGATRGPRKVPL